MTVMLLPNAHSQALARDMPICVQALRVVLRGLVFHFAAICYHHLELFLLNYIILQPVSHLCSLVLNLFPDLQMAWQYNFSFHFLLTP